MKSVALAIDSACNTEYQFADSAYNCACLIQHSNQLGLHVCNNEPARKVGESILRCCSCFLPTGKKTRHICYNCGVVVREKLIVAEGLEWFGYCSRVCHDNNSDTRSGIESVVSILYNDNRFSDSDSESRRDILVLLSILLMRSSNACDSKQSSIIIQLLKLESHDNVEIPELFQLAQQFEDILASSSSPLHRHLLDLNANASSSVSAMITKLVRVIRFNSYSIPVPNVPGTFLLTIHPILGRLNHSCAPNAIVQHRSSSFRSTSDNGEIELVVKVILPIGKGDAVTISYLSDLLLPVDTRKHLLKSSFYFECNCSRCERESVGYLNDLADSEFMTCPLYRICTQLMLTSTNRTANRGPFEWCSYSVELCLQNSLSLLQSYPPTINSSVVDAICSTSMFILGRMTEAKFLPKKVFELRSGEDRNTFADVPVNLAILYEHFGEKYVRQAAVLLACGVISKCSVVLNCSISTKQLELLLKGVSAAANLMKSWRGKTAHDFLPTEMLLISESKSLITRMKELLTVVIENVESSRDDNVPTSYSSTLKKVVLISNELDCIR